MGHHKEHKKTVMEHVTGIEKKKDKDVIGTGANTVDMSQSTTSKIFNVVVRLATIAVFVYVFIRYIKPLF